MNLAGKLSLTMTKVLERLERGDARIVPLQGGYWLPGDVADELPQDGTAWFEKAIKEFGCQVGTQTVYALRDRGMLIPGERGYDKRPEPYALRIHTLSNAYAELLSK